MVRLIARLDIKGPNLIKGIQLEGLRVIGDPAQFAKEYYEAGIDELIFMDIVASLYGRNQLGEIIKRTAREVFVPMTVGGGIRTLEDVQMVLRSGADKVAVNTAAVKDPSLISQISNRYGAQCMVLSIEAKQVGPGRWQAFTDNGREPTGLDVVDWAKRGVELGAGEILLTSVDREGTRRGFDAALVQTVAGAVSIPVVASGGMGNLSHLTDVVQVAGASAVAVADALHYRRFKVQEMKSALRSKGVVVR